MAFLQIASISSHFNCSASASASGAWPETGVESYGAAVGGSYSEQPTLTYSPMEGKDFASRILTETDMSTFVRLVRAGWRIDHLLRMMVQRIGRLRNYPAPPAAGGEPTDYQRFLRVADTWQELHDRGDLRFIRAEEAPVVLVGSIPADQVKLDTFLSVDQAGYSLVSNEDGTYRLLKPARERLLLEVRYRQAALADRVDGSLGIRPERIQAKGGGVLERIRLIASHEMAGPPAQAAAEDLPIQLRSYSDVLYYVAQGVEVPGEHVERGLTRVYTDRQGRPVDRRKLTADLLNVRRSGTPPAGALVPVYFRGRWFYIDDGDADSKDAFALLSIVFALQSREERTAKPVLTIPVSH